MIARYWYRNKKNGYSHTSQIKILKSGFTVSQTRYALSKAWTGYKIAKNKGGLENMKNYASIIHKLQRAQLDAGMIYGKIFTYRWMKSSSEMVEVQSRALEQMEELVDQITSIMYWVITVTAAVVVLQLAGFHSRHSQMPMGEMVE